MKLSPRDRRFVIALAVFLVGAGSYVGYLDPLQAKVRRSAQTVQARRKEVWKQEQKLRELRSWREDHERLLQRVAVWHTGLRLPGVGAALADVLKAMGKAAAAANVEVSNLRPMPRLLADGTTQVIDSFVLEGHATIEAFDRLLWELQGMAVTEVTVSRGETADGPPRFHLRADLLPQESIVRLGGATAAAAESPLALADDLFQPKQPKTLPQAETDLVAAPSAAPPPAPVPPPPEQPADPTLGTLALRGVAEIAGQQVAVLADGDGKADLLLSRGELYREWIVHTVDAGGVTFQARGGGQTARLVLPQTTVPPLALGTTTATASATGPERGETSAAPVAPARLGLSLRQLTAEEAQARFGEGGGALLVTGVSRPDALVRIDDVIREVGGVRVGSVGEVMEVLRGLRPSTTVAIRVQRQRQTLDLTLTLL